MDKKTADFIVLVINIVAEKFFNGRKDISYKQLNKLGLINFYSSTFDVSHTLSSDYILSEVKEKLKGAQF
jgi:hypothetical protein